jgi:RNA polymerase sigma factor (sigma-70 family)
MKILEINSDDIKLNEIENAGQNFDSVYALDVNTSLRVEENKSYNFVGKALIYDEEIFINTKTGEGYDLVIGKMKNYIDWYSGKIRLAGFDRDDIKQLIAMILLDGIRRYNPSLKFRLSTFLYVHIRNRIISRIKEETRQSLNATYNAPHYKFICPCGSSFSSNREEAQQCNTCKTPVSNTWIIRAEHIEPISLDGIMSSQNDDESSDKVSRIHYNGQQSSLIDFFGKVENADDIDRDLDFSSILSEEDEVTRKIAELMYNEDFSITDAAKEVGLTCWAASLRLKKLKSKKHIREFFFNR